jgi:hypothetical protein
MDMLDSRRRHDDESHAKLMKLQFDSSINAQQAAMKAQEADHRALLVNLEANTQLRLNSQDANLKLLFERQEASMKALSDKQDAHTKTLSDMNDASTKTQEANTKALEVKIEGQFWPLAIKLGTFTSIVIMSSLAIATYFGISVEVHHQVWRPKPSI